jgi:hypothetical protein
MLGIDLKRFDGIPEAWDCFVTGVNVANIDTHVTTPELNDMIGGIAQCLIAAEEGKGGDKSKLAALHRLSIATALLTELPQQLLDFVASGLQEAARDSVKDFRLRSSATPSTRRSTSGDGRNVACHNRIATNHSFGRTSRPIDG